MLCALEYVYYVCPVANAAHLQHHVYSRGDTTNYFKSGEYICTISESYALNASNICTYEYKVHESYAEPCTEGAHAWRLFDRIRNRM